MARSPRRRPSPRPRPDDPERWFSEKMHDGPAFDRDRYYGRPPSHEDRGWRQDLVPRHDSYGMDRDRSDHRYNSSDRGYHNARPRYRDQSYRDGNDYGFRGYSNGQEDRSDQRGRGPNAQPSRQQGPASIDAPRPSRRQRSSRGRSWSPPHAAGNTQQQSAPPMPGSDFDFRFDAPPSIFQNLGQEDQNAIRRDRRPPTSHRYGNKSRPYRPYNKAVKAADRPFLKAGRSPTPERMAGMDETEASGRKYIALEDVSDSQEDDMDISTNEESGEDESNQPQKKVVRTENVKSDGGDAPRWSNPDPYTALPPLNDAQRKKKDVVKLIRKARISASAVVDENARSKTVNDDFISFDFDDDKFEREEPQPEALSANKLLPSKPPVSATYSHKMNLHEALPSKPKVAETDVSISDGRMPMAHLTPDSALGSRKRTHNDEIKPPFKPIKNFAINRPSDGKVVARWRSKENLDPTPWCQGRRDHSQSRLGLWLHHEIVDFYEQVKPRDYEEAVRTRLISELRAAVRRVYPDADIYSFGSFPAGLYLPTADMDLVLVSQQYMDGGYGKYNSKSLMFKFKNFLLKSKIANPDYAVDTIIGAKVPIIKYTDKITGLSVDISFENDTGIVANKTFAHWKHLYPAMPPLVTLIKQFLTMRGLNEPVNGGIGGFSVICLVVHMLSNMPQVQSGSMVAEEHLGEILMEFFDLYGNEFDAVTTGLQMNPPRYLSKRKIKDMVYKLAEDECKFSIIDPNDPSNDIAGGSRNTERILRCFSDAYAALRERMANLEKLPAVEKKGQSILGTIIGGNYTSFDWQRDHLYHVHASSALH